MKKRKAKKDQKAKEKAQSGSMARKKSEQRPLIGASRASNNSDLTPRWLEDYSLLPDEPLFGEYLEMSK